MIKTKDLIPGYWYSTEAEWSNHIYYFFFKVYFHPYIYGDIIVFDKLLKSINLYGHQVINYYNDFVLIGKDYTQESMIEYIKAFQL